MHDPMTVAFEIKLLNYHLLTIWHVDPETDGTDDSCGWTRPSITERESEIANDVAKWEIEIPYYTSPHLLISLELQLIPSIIPHKYLRATVYLLFLRRGNILRGKKIGAETF